MPPTELILGTGASVHPSVEITGPRRVVIGDYAQLAAGVRIFGGGEVEIGDYTKIHNGVSICANQSVRIGQVAWVGEHAHLDGTGGLEIGDFSCIGMKSQLYSHIRNGDVLEGCNFEKAKPLVIGADVWLVGLCMVSPCTIGDKAVALMGSVIARDLPGNRVYAGNPPQDITHKFPHPPYTARDPEEKRVRLDALVDEFFQTLRPEGTRARVRVVNGLPANRDPALTYYDVATRAYTKTHHPDEVALNRWLFSARAKFRSCVQGNCGDGVGE